MSNNNEYGHADEISDNETDPQFYDREEKRPKRTLLSRGIGGVAGLTAFSYALDNMSEGMEVTSESNTELNCLISKEDNFFIFCTNNEQHDPPVLIIAHICRFFGRTFC